MPASTKAEANALIDKLRRKNGGLTAEHRQRLERTEPELLEMFDSIKLTLGAATKTLATNLYAKDTRFVYELIQNAEDNSYIEATRKSELPSLAFTLKNDRIIIDSNEDGFAEENISAICSIGESTKKSIKGYIGEKGIGFKSVFKVARKVHVQSGLYSFSFKYDQGTDDDGLGMVTPWIEDQETLPNGVRTRLTLFLLDECSRSQLCDDFTNLPDTLLLFLTKLKKLSIRIELSDRPVDDIRYSLSVHDAFSVIIKTHNEKGWRLRFLTKRRTITDMPYDDARKLKSTPNPDGSVERKWIKEAEVVLSFPLDKHGRPKMKEQHVYAFLPLRKVGFRFLVQSDFITQASREDVFDRPWNRRLLEEAARLYEETIPAFLGDQILKHAWIRYLPVERVADEFWQRLQHLILERVKTSASFFSRARNKYKPANLRILLDRFKGDDNEPLLPDTTPDRGTTAYVDPLYDNVIDIPILRALGSLDLSLSEFVDRLKFDIETNQAPRMHSKGVTSTWHERVAQLLIEAIDSGSLTRISNLAIVPLNNKRWVKPQGASIFLPSTGGVDIPLDLGLSLIDKASIQNATRAKMFTKLGIDVCAPSRVMPLIRQQYFERRFPFVSYDNHFAHLAFLYGHQEECKKWDMLTKAFDSNNELFRVDQPALGWLYRGDGAEHYAPSKILHNAAGGVLRNQIRILHSMYSQRLQRLPRRNNQDAKIWVYKYLGAEATLRLGSRGNDDLMSPELKYIIESRPEVLLGTLRINWSLYKSSWWSTVANCQIPIMSSDAKKKLCDTVLPTSKLVDTARRLSLQANFGFIEEIAGISSATEGRWHFLDQFGVVKDDGYKFWLAMLKQAKSSGCSSVSTVAEIYGELQRTCRTDDDIDTLRKCLEKDDCVFIPGQFSYPSQWISSSQCVWDGPTWFNHLHRLKGITAYHRLGELFHNILNISDAGTEHFLANLKTLKIESHFRAVMNSERDLIFNLYKALSDCGSTQEPRDRIRTVFESDHLIYHPSRKSWHPPSSCVWAEDHIHLPNKISILTVYTAHASLFVTILKVQKPTLAMHVRALIEKASSNTRTKREILDAMLLICAFNPSKNDLETLDSCPCFPIKTKAGSLEWRSCSAVFHIVDRREYGQIFENRLDMLDYNLEEVHSIKKFLMAVGLENSLTSRAAKEETRAVGISSLDKHLTKQMQRKAYAICRYVAHQRSSEANSNPLSMLRMLETLQVYQNDAISKVVTISEGHVDISRPGASALFHIEEAGNCLKLFIPAQAKERFACRIGSLERGLLNHLGAETHTAPLLLWPIIDAPDLDTLDYLLEHHGIISLAGIDRPDENELEYPATAIAQQAQAAGSRVSTYQAPERPVHEVNRSLPPVLAPETPRRSIDIPNVITPPQESTVAEVLTPSTSVLDSVLSLGNDADNQYNLLLDFVIKGAQSLSTLPRKYDTLIIDPTIQPPANLEISTALYSNVRGEREFKTGVAGELFMFELLKMLDLPAFGRENWQSRLRQRVAIHETYSDLTSWYGVESSDFVYDDIQSKFTQLLIDNGYL